MTWNMRRQAACTAIARSPRQRLAAPVEEAADCAGVAASITRSSPRHRIRRRDLAPARRPCRSAPSPDAAPAPRCRAAPAPAPAARVRHVLRGLADGVAGRAESRARWRSSRARERDVGDARRHRASSGASACVSRNGPIALVRRLSSSIACGRRGRSVRRECSTPALLTSRSSARVVIGDQRQFARPARRATSHRPRPAAARAGGRGIRRPAR